MLKKRLLNAFLIFVIGVMLAGLVTCGGGGGGGESTTSNDIAPSITSHPQDISVVVGGSATFSVTAAGTAPLSYQWKKNGLNVGTNSSSYITPITTMGDNGAKFSVVVSNTAGFIESNEATLTVTITAVAPTITSHPQDTGVIEGQTATFSVTASGTAPLSYQWKKNGANVGTNSSFYTTPVTTMADNGAKMSVVVSNTVGHAISNEATLTVTATAVPPIITSHPQDIMVIEGQSATFSVTASGTAPLSYQWKKNGVNVGSDSPSYTTPSTTMGDNGAKFSVAVTNMAGRADGKEANLTVNASSGGAIIINHTSTNLSQVPSTWITAAKSNLKIAYGHTSHGSQIITGMSALAAVNPFYSFNNGGISDALDLRDTPFSGAYDLGSPDRTSWAAATRNYLNAHPEVNVIIWSWCGQVSDATSSDITIYLNLMSGLERDYPGMKFVYMTGHLDGSGTSGNLNQRNEQIRAYCQANNKILFDFADIESYDPSGATSFMALNADDGCNYSGGNWASQWIAAHPTDPLATLAASCGDCAHSEKLNCILKGRAAWWLWARLAGWTDLAT